MVNGFLITLGLLPAIVWLAFFLWEDKKRPEPKGLILSTFILGGLATFFVLQFQTILQQAIVIPSGLNEIGVFSIFWLAGIEEVVKFLVVFLWISYRQSFDEPIDAMIYMIIAGLGFATVENIVTVTDYPANNFELITLRFIGATLLHSLSSALVGFYWAKSFLNQKYSWLIIILGLLLATIIHSIFNNLVLAFGPSWHVTVFLVFIAFFILNDFEKLKKATLT